MNHRPHQHDAAVNAMLVVQYERIRQILRDCRITQLSPEELARVRLFYAHAGVHPKAVALAA